MKSIYQLVIASICIPFGILFTTFLNSPSSIAEFLLKNNIGVIAILITLVGIGELLSYLEETFKEEFNNIKVSNSKNKFKC